MTTGIRPPGPKGKFLAGSVYEISKDRIGFLLWLSRQYGDLARFTVWGTDLYLVADPDHVHEILVTNNKNFRKARALDVAKYIVGEGLLTSGNELHRRQRKMMQPAFHTQRVGAYAQTMIDFAARYAERWDRDGLDGQPIDVWQEMMRLTLSIVAKTLFDADIDSKADDFGEALTTLMRLFERVTHPAAPLLMKLPTPNNVRFRLARARIEKVIYKIIAERRANPSDRGDLLSMLLTAVDDEDGAAMSDKQVRDEAVTLFLAGHETTANALTWTWYLLSQNPATETKLHAEVDTVLGGRLPTPGDLPKLEYTRRVLAESMRLYPPAYIVGRESIEAFRLGRFTLPAGAVLLLCPFVTHRNANHFPEPERFNPDRWKPEMQADRHKFAYFPFGGGPRTCIGEPFAWMEGVLLLAVLAQSWQLKLAPGHPVEFDPQITLRPQHGMSMTLTRRASNPVTTAAAG